ncbi:MAG TPA: ABC transporter permease, partial [Blastocatellia bacterium]|nr:ABC transporter permease [Blastocatellia bacterium]
MDSLHHDLRYALRMLTKSPGFTAIAVIALALGIGANTAIFSVVNAVLLRSLPFKDPDRIIAINKVAEKGELPGISSVEYFAWQEQGEVFEELAAHSTDSFILTGIGEPERLTCARLTASAFSLLGVQPVAGRVFLPEEDRPGNNQVVVVSQGFWQRRYGGDPNLIGQAITLNDKPYTVVGVMPASFQFPRSYEIWMPLALDEKEKTGDTWTLAEVIARLKPGVTEERVESDLNTMAGRLAEQYKDWPMQARFEAVPLHRHLVGDMRLALLILLGAVGFVLAIACANVANLLLSRAADRQKEMAIRTALGAVRWRIIRQLLTESVLLSLMGGALGILLALWSVDLLVSSIPQDMANSLHGMGEVSIDRQVLGFTLALSILTGIFFGLAPAFVASKPDVNQMLKEGSARIAAGSGLRSLRGLLVVSELALALVLLIGAGLLLKSFMRMLDVPPGYKPEGVLTMRVDLPRARYAKSHQTSAFFKQTLDRMKELPEVESVGAISGLPLSGYIMMAFFQVEGPVQMERGKDPSVPIGMVSPDYFKTMGIPLLQGRAFTEQDADGAPGVVIINESMARKFWPDENPIGKRV